jgi:AcrR family transcriptional regulator
MNKNPEKRKETRERMLQAFFAEYRDKNLRKITVGSIAKGAKVNRSTFYDHFSDIYDLLDQAQDELLTEMTACVRQLVGKSDVQKKKLFPEMGAYILKEYGERIALLLGRGDTGFSEKLIGTMKPMLNSVLHVDISDQKTDFVVSFILSGVTGYITALYASDGPIDIQDSVFTLQALMASALNAIPAPQ